MRTDRVYRGDFKTTPWQEAPIEAKGHDPVLEIDTRLDLEVKLEKLRREAKKLSINLQKVLFYVYYEGFSERRIAKLMNLSRWNIRRMVEKLDHFFRN